MSRLKLIHSDKGGEKLFRQWNLKFGKADFDSKAYIVKYPTDMPEEINEYVYF